MVRHQKEMKLKEAEEKARKQELLAKQKQIEEQAVARRASQATAEEDMVQARGSDNDDVAPVESPIGS